MKSKSVPYKESGDGVDVATDRASPKLHGLGYCRTRTHERIKDNGTRNPHRLIEEIEHI